MDRMIFPITSQEVHNNDRKWFEGYRLQMVVYGLCELLLFYKNNICSDKNDISDDEIIEPTTEEFVFPLIKEMSSVLQKDADGWMSMGRLAEFNCYLNNPDKLKSLGFDIVTDGCQFKFAEEV